jgi:hypothetical protein
VESIKLIDMKTELNLNFPLDFIEEKIDAVAKGSFGTFKVTEKHIVHKTFVIAVTSFRGFGQIDITLSKIDDTNTTLTYTASPQAGSDKFPQKVDDFFETLNKALLGQDVDKTKSASSFISVIAILIAIAAIIYMLI